MKEKTLDANGLITSASAKWEDKISDEAINFVQAVSMNFAHGIDQTMIHLPKDTPENRTVQLDIFFEALIGVVVKITSTYGNSAKEMEDAIIHILRDKFAYVRKRQAEQRNVQIAGKPT